MIRLALALIVVMLAMGVADVEGVAHNSPPIVEQQGVGNSCTTWNYDPVTGISTWDGGSLADCVTNAGPCVWDPDDYLRLGNGVAERGADGIYRASASACLFADWTAHNWVVHAWDLAHRPRPFDVTLDFNGQPFQMHVEDGHGLMCVIGPDYDQEYTGFSLIPLQGGGGLAQGYAVPTTVTATIAGKSRRLSLSLESHLTDNYCPPGPLTGLRTGEASYQWAKSD